MAAAIRWQVALNRDVAPRVARQSDVPEWPYSNADSDSAQSRDLIEGMSGEMNLRLAS